MATVENEAGEKIDYEAAVQLMDDEIRESLHRHLAPCSDQKFFDAYCEVHLKAFGKEFPPNASYLAW